MFFVDVFTGLRQGEIVGLTWDCVDFDNGIIRVEKQLKRKTGKEKEQSENRLKYGSSYDNKDNLILYSLMSLADTSV